MPHIRITHPHKYPVNQGGLDIRNRQGYYPQAGNADELKEESIIRHMKANPNVPVVDVQIGYDGEWDGRYVLLDRDTPDERLLKLPPDGERFDAY